MMRSWNLRFMGYVLPYDFVLVGALGVAWALESHRWLEELGMI